MVRMSRTRGMRCSVTGSSVSSAAASAGSAEFLEPLVGISPLSGGAALDHEFIHDHSSLAAFAQCLPHAPPCGQTPFRFLAVDAGLAHHDRDAHAVAARRQQFAGALVDRRRRPAR